MLGHVCREEYDDSGSAVLSGAFIFFFSEPVSRPNERVMDIKISFPVVEHFKYEGYHIYCCALHCPGLTMKSLVKQRVSKSLLFASSCY